MEHQCMGINCAFPGCQNNPHNHPVRHRTGLRRMTLAEFRKKYGSSGGGELLLYMLEHIPSSKEFEKGFKEYIHDIARLLQED